MPKLRLVSDTPISGVGATVAVPDKVTVFVPAFEAMLRVAVFAPGDPDDAGLNVTSTVQLSPGCRVRVPTQLVLENSAESVPVIDTSVIFASAFPMLLIVTLALPVSPMVTAPKSTDSGAFITGFGAIALPDKETETVFVHAFDEAMLDEAMLRVAVFAPGDDVGLNVTSTVQLLSGARVAGSVPQ